MVIPPLVPPSITGRIRSGLGPKTASAPFWNMIDAPMVAMITGRKLRLRRG